MFATPSNNTTIYNATTTRNNYITVHNGSDPSIDHKSSFDLTTPSNSNITVYNATTQSYNEKALSNTTIPSNQNTTVYNTKTGSNNHSTVYNAKSLTEHYTPVYNATTAKNNFTAGNNATTPQNNLTLVYNATTLTENLIPYNKTTNNFTTVYNTKTTNNYRTTNSASLNEKHTNEYNLTTVSSNYTTLNNSTTSIKKNYTTFTATAPSNNYTTVYNTTAITEKHLHNYNTTASSNNYTSVYNATSSNTKHTAVQNTTTPSNSYTTEQNVTAKNNHTTVYYATKSSINVTTVHKLTMTSINFTTNQNITYITSNFTNKYNATLFTTTSNTASPSKSSTTNMVGVQNTTALNYSSTLHPAINSSIIYTSVTRSPRNATTAFNISIAPVDPQQITTTLNINTTVVAALTEVGRTTKLNSTTESWTSLADKGTKPTQHSMLNQTGNRTTVTVTQTTTVYKNDSNLGAGFSTIQATKPLRSNLTKDTVSPFTATTVNTILTTHDPTKKSPVSSATKTTTLPSDKATMSTVTSTGNTLMTTMKTSTSTENKEEKANELLDQTEDVSKLNSSLVSNLVGNLEKLLESPSISQSVGKKVIDIISNLMNCDPEILSGSTNRLIQLVDTLGLKLEVMGVSGMLSSTSLVLAIKTVDGTNFPETSVEIFNTDNVQLRSISRSRVKRSASALGSVNLPSSLTAGLLPEEKLQASRVQFTFYKNNSFFQDSSLDNQTVVSSVLGSSVANLSISNLKENITFTIRHMSLSLNDITSCVFWNFTKNNKAGGWDDNGCSVANTTAEHTTCSCNHLTSFAILLDMSREGITDPLQAKILSFITYIGCGISSVFLAVTLITHLLFEKLLHDIPAKILVQLCFSLLLLNLVFMLDGWLANYKIVNLCISTAFFLHYFLLSSFTWAGLEALHMYLSIVRVFTPYLSRYMLKFSLMGWGFPLIVVVIIIAVDKNNYGLVPYGKYEDGTTDDFCWLRNDIAFYVGVVAYFLLIFVLCLVVFIVVMVQLYRIKKQNPHNQSPNRSAMTDMRSIIGLVLLLGLTWGFALFAWGDAKLPFIYLFTIFNSLLGLFVFIFHCAVKENVRRMWRMYLCCGNLRLANNLEWSRTATHNNKQLSAATGATSAQQLSNRSSSFASNLTNSSGSVFVDSGISDHSNSDVVLNEIQRRNISPIDEP
ncbi:adhesion G-protein coupled receptor G2 [Cyprinodon tularosa]|uniref:adhesion G-protein coupled receptor G2 n=1 Tax=Cyprinodon tularosa TaxID=77115 RepID=UPI0018E1DEBA|nr:adhesion G-protein coupled receptor G2 [Cyprinodon tularosa]